MKRVLFLDIVGVLNSRRTLHALGQYPLELEHLAGMSDPVALRMLQRLCDSAGVSVVLSSVWRKSYAFADVGKALGLTEDVTARLAASQWGSWGTEIGDHHIRQAGLDPANPMIARAVLVENGGFGAQSAAPIARMVFDYYLLGKHPKGPAREDESADEEE